MRRMMPWLMVVASLAMIAGAWAIKTSRDRDQTPTAAAQPTTVPTPSPFAATPQPAATAATPGPAATTALQQSPVQPASTPVVTAVPIQTPAVTPAPAPSRSGTTLAQGADTPGTGGGAVAGGLLTLTLALVAHVAVGAGRYSWRRRS